MKKYPMVMIEWLDHTADASWIEDIKECKYEVCQTVGWLVEEDDKVFKVANAITKDSGVGGISVILKTCVEEFWFIEMSDEDN